MDAKRLNEAYEMAAAQCRAEGRSLATADGETAWKLGWIDGFNAAVFQMRRLVEQPMADLTKVLRENYANN